MEDFEKVLKQQELQMEDTIKDFEKCKESKDKADANVKELKEELRKMIRQ